MEAGALDLDHRGIKGASWGPGSGPQGSQLGPCPHKQKSRAAHSTYIDFHDGNNKRIKIDDTRVLWEWEKEESIKTK